MSETDTSKYVSAEDLVATAEKDVDVNGSIYRIKRITAHGVMTGLQKAIDVSSLGDTADPEVMKRMRKKAESNMSQYIETILTAGLLIPKIGEKGLKVDHIPFVHQQILFSSILDLSGVSKDAIKRTAPFDKGTSESPSTQSAGGTGDSPPSS